MQRVRSKKIKYASNYNNVENLKHATNQLKAKVIIHSVITSFRTLKEIAEGVTSEIRVDKRRKVNFYHLDYSNRKLP